MKKIKVQKPHPFQAGVSLEAFEAASKRKNREGLKWRFITTKLLELYAKKGSALFNA